MTTSGNVTILEAMAHSAIWARWFRDPATWEAWRAFLAALFGLPMSEAELALFRRCTGRGAPPDGGLSEAWLICGRRAGKSFVLALIAVFSRCSGIGRLISVLVSAVRSRSSPSTEGRRG